MNLFPEIESCCGTCTLKPGMSLLGVLGTDWWRWSLKGRCHAGAGWSASRVVNFWTLVSQCLEDCVNSQQHIQFRQNATVRYSSELSNRPCSLTEDNREIITIQAGQCGNSSQWFPIPSSCRLSSARMSYTAPYDNREYEADVDWAPSWKPVLATALSRAWHQPGR